MIKKLLVAVLAMAMVLGTMVIPASAAGKEVTVTVEWAGVEELGDTVSLWCWGGGDLGLNYNANSTWPGDEMTKNADGTYTVTISGIEEDTVKVIPNVTTADGAVLQTVDSEAIDISTGAIKVVVGELGEPNDEGKANYTIDSAVAVEGSAAGDAPAGDSTAVMGYVVAAVVALAAVVTVVSKKRSVEA